MFQSSIVGVSAKSVRRKSDGREMVIYEIQDTEGRVWTTTKKTLASEANRLVGQPVAIDGRIEQNGNFLNHYLENLMQMTTPSGSFTPPQGAVLPPLPPAPIPTPAPVAPLPTPSNGHTDKDWAIMRQTAGKVSALISQDAGQFWSNVDDLVNYFATGTKPSIIGNGNGNQFIPTEVPDQPSFSGTYADEDIPF